jgi:hypothetical protein
MHTRTQVRLYAWKARNILILVLSSQTETVEYEKYFSSPRTQRLTSERERKTFIATKLKKSIYDHAHAITMTVEGNETHVGWM